jgi:hypothetical protein
VEFFIWFCAHTSKDTFTQDVIITMLKIMKLDKIPVFIEVLQA